MCEGKRVALLAFLPRCMPENRRPILHVNFYYPFGEIGKRIREEWEEKDNVCVKDETTFILKHIGQDMEVTCDKKGNPEPLVSMLETQILDCVPYELIDFELDYTCEYTNEVNIKLRVYQEECRSEMDIKQKLIDPQADEPEEVEMEVEPEPSIHLRVPKRVTDQMIGAISSRKIHADRFSVLVNALGFSTKDFGRFVSDNISSAGSRKGYAGTKKLLTRWRNRTDEADQRPELREAFKRSNLPDLTKRYLQVKDDFYD
ncbi:uncharacterized protein LOC105442390 [Strongylocentrotus purpuratus]|uniref:Death domain-containing protein n=1 Tax=Strongylocentrotus purpuratus TaxID=7668 RepID=A0A7M7LW40_STRPU|nr:uncharacterized protein LOC105442390 [Strongylocentrotus purpuratus]|eukprot:XP_011672752.1 PREDICTED: uncharacterized protein LOC105442390 [Strongylocentrotus purpuratus]